MKLEQAVRGMDCHEVAAAFHAFDRHSLVMGWGFVDSTAGGAMGIEHHGRMEFFC